MRSYYNRRGPYANYHHWKLTIERQSSTITENPKKGAEIASEKFHHLTEAYQ